jgi:hypothetical protein
MGCDAAITNSWAREEQRRNGKEGGRYLRHARWYGGLYYSGKAATEGWARNTQRTLLSVSTSTMDGTRSLISVRKDDGAVQTTAIQRGAAARNCQCVRTG